MCISLFKTLNFPTFIWTLGPHTEGKRHSRNIMGHPACHILSGLWALPQSSLGSHACSVSRDVKPAKVTMGWGEQSQFLFFLFFFCVYPLICTVVYSEIGASLVAQTVKIYLQCRRPGLERSPRGGHSNPLQYSCQGQRSLVGYRWQVYPCLLKCWFSLDVYPGMGLLGLKVLLYFVF